MPEEEERIFTIPLRNVKTIPRTKRAPVAIRTIKSYICRHMKSDEDKVWIDNDINQEVWSRGIQKPPSKIRVKAIKFEDGLVEVSLPGE